MKKRKPKFWIILSENHETTFPGRPYNFLRFDSRERAEEGAEVMAAQHSKRFHVMEEVVSFAPAIAPIKREE